VTAVDLSGYFSNLHLQMKDLVRQLSEAAGPENLAPGRAEIVDSRGRVVRNPQKATTYLSASRANGILDRYGPGEGVKKLTVEYGVHRSTIWRHAVKRGVVAA
jgi:hypothetical protein